MFHRLNAICFGWGEFEDVAMNFLAVECGVPPLRSRFFCLVAFLSLKIVALKHFYHSN